MLVIGIMDKTCMYIMQKYDDIVKWNAFGSIGPLRGESITHDMPFHLIGVSFI